LNKFNGKQHKPKITTKEDFSHEVKKDRPFFIRVTLVLLGSISLTLGIIGIFLPILPTTPFILFATFLYSKSSHRFYNWIMSHGIVGKYIRQWRNNRSIPFKIKILAMFLVLLTISTSILFVTTYLVIKILLAIIGISVIIFLTRIKTT